MAIDYSKRPSGTSKREWEAQQTGGTLNYDTGKISGASVPASSNIYSGDNVLSALTNPVAKPDYSSVENINKSLMKSLDTLNKQDLEYQKGLGKIQSQTGLGLIPMTRDAEEFTRKSNIGRQGLADVVTAKQNALNAAKEAYATSLSQFNTDRSFEADQFNKNREYALDERKLNQSITESNKENLYQLATRMKNEGRSWGEIADEAGKAGFDLTPGSEDSKSLDSIMTGQAITNSKPMSVTSAEAVSNVISGLDSIDKIEGMDTGWGNRLQEKLPGALGARDLRYEYDNIRDILQRMRTGAAISETEESFYKDQIPGLFDTEATRKRKLETLKGLFSRIKTAVDPNSSIISDSLDSEYDVIDIKSGKTGTIPASEFDSSKYIRI